MKKEALILLYFVLFFLIINIAEAIDVINRVTGETITGKVPSQQTNVSILVQGAAPTLSLIRPENKTYLFNESILLNYSATNEAEVWYNLDDEENTTITSYVYFNATQGQHTLNLYANNSDGNETSTSATFIANSSRIIIPYDEFNGTTKGASTDFYSYTYEDLQNLSIILENAEYGKIVFNAEINVTNDEVPSDDDVDIDSFVNVSFNRIELNASALPNFNKSATLSLYNLTYTNPRILMNEQVCPSNICTIDNYNSSSGILSFNVTSFTIYSAEETPTTSPTAGVGPGGGGTVETKNESFSIDIDKIEVSIVVGDTTTREIKVKNTGKETLSIKTRVEGRGLDEIIKFENERIELKTNEEKTFRFNITAKEREIYTGKIILSSNSMTKEILIIINTQSKEALFDIFVSITERSVVKGEKVKAQINLIPIGEKGLGVTSKYLIKDFKGEVHYEESDTLYIEGQKSFIKEFDTINLNYEDYILGAELTYIGGFASASSHFIVIEKEKPLSLVKKSYKYLTTFIVLMIFILFVIFEFRKMKRYKKLKKQ